ncbi:thioesterase domain-containing protein [Maridesulfovibrio sp.]|uniref:thioesterase II family protein n=1 Tax=Maridesulfovibrio sp. TaxID=2795000 RepID=UPI002A18A866|nr:thioesterase domain-containing protein [Maridesulfovibrio sp.]
MSAWIMPEIKNSARGRLFCFPFAGGGASAYRNWLGESSDDLEIIAIQPPGRENRMGDRPLESMDEIVTEAVREIMKFGDCPFSFFGHSLGARVAFECVRRLRQLNCPLPEHLFVSGSRSPEIPEPKPLHHLDDSSFVEELKRFSGTPQVILENRELMELFLPILRADFTVDETYSFVEAAPLTVPVTAFCGTDDEEATLEEMEGWRRHTASSFFLHSVKGEHFFILESWRDVLGCIRETLSSHESFYLRDAV